MRQDVYSVPCLSDTLEMYQAYLAKAEVGGNYQQRFLASLVFMLVQAAAKQPPDIRLQMAPHELKKLRAWVAEALVEYPAPAPTPTSEETPDESTDAVEAPSDDVSAVPADVSSQE